MGDALVGHLPRPLLPGGIPIGLVEVLQDSLVVGNPSPFHLSADRDDTNFPKTLEPEGIVPVVASEFTTDRVVSRGGSDHGSTLVGRGMLDCEVTVVGPAFLNACPFGCIRFAKGCERCNVALAE